MYALGMTDLRWHERFLIEPTMGVVNYWTPTPWAVRLPPGSRWFFMLKAPIRRIGGFGTLYGYEDLTVREAWSRYGLGNGVQSAEELHNRVRGYAESRSKFPVASDPIIGCVLLQDCVFLPEELQVRPEDVGIEFERQIVKYKRYDGELTLPFEAELPRDDEAFRLVEPGQNEWVLQNQKERVGQAPFRRKVLDAYGGRCAVTGADCREALDAAHIQPFISLASNHVQNGLALRKDLHALFDAGFVTVTPVLEVRVSPRLTSHEYAALDGAKLRLPISKKDHPSPAALEHHRLKVFRL